MDLDIARQKAAQILNEELIAPTVSYVASGPDPGDQAAWILNLSKTISVIADLPSARTRRPRTLLGDPTLFQLDSVNYTLLQSVLSQLSEASQSSFFKFLGGRLSYGVACRSTTLNTYPKWGTLVSDFPLIVEFLVRNGAVDEVFSVLKKKYTTMIPGHVLMLQELEEMIALNYTVLTEASYELLRNAVLSFRESMVTFAEGRATKRAVNNVLYGEITYKGLDVPIRLALFRREVLAACDGLVEQCRKAEYLYLKESLLAGLNIELNQDKAKVEGYLTKFGFSPFLSRSLEEADRLFQERSTPFEYKSSVGHLRSFLETMQTESIDRIYSKFGGNMPTSWGTGLAWLSQHDVLSKKEQTFAASFYTLISDEAIHPLIAEREYARLARNMVIEYALLFLTKIDKV